MTKANKVHTEEEIKRTTERATDEEVIVETEETKRTTDKEGDDVKVPFYKRKLFWGAVAVAGAGVAVYLMRNTIPGVSAVVTASQELSDIAQDVVPDVEVPTEVEVSVES